MSVEDELAIHRTLAEYCQCLDDGAFDTVADLFTPDGTFAFYKTVVTGRDALSQWFREAQPPERRGKHVSINPVVDVEAGGEQAAVTSDFLFLRWIDGTLTTETVGRYRDAFVRVDGRWRIARRDTEMMRPPR